MGGVLLEKTPQSFALRFCELLDVFDVEAHDLLLDPVPGATQNTRLRRGPVALAFQDAVRRDAAASEDLEELSPMRIAPHDAGHERSSAEAVNIESGVGATSWNELIGLLPENQNRCFPADALR